jgi:hypothetical protein
VNVQVHLYSYAGALVHTVTDWSKLQFGLDLKGGCGDLCLRTDSIDADDVPVLGEARVIVNGTTFYSGQVLKAKRDPVEIEVTEITAGGWSNELASIWRGYRRDWRMSTSPDQEAEEVADRFLGLSAPLSSKNIVLGGVTRPGTRLTNVDGSSAFDSIVGRDTAPGSIWGVDENKVLYAMVVPTAVAANGHLTYPGDVASQSLEKDAAELVNALHLRSSQARKSWNLFKNGALLDWFTDQDNDADYDVAPPNNTQQRFGKQIEGWTIIVQCLTGDDSDNVTLVNTYSSGDWPTTFGDYGVDLVINNTAPTSRQAEIRPSFDEFGAGLAPGYVTNQGDARPKVQASVNYTAKVKVWVDDSGSYVLPDFRWDFYWYAGTAYQGVSSLAWQALSAGWNSFPWDGIGTDTRFTTVSSPLADCCVPVLSLRAAGPAHVKIAGLQFSDTLACPESATKFMQALPYERILTVEDAWAASLDSYVRDSITDYGLRMAFEQQDLEGDDDSQVFAGNLFSQKGVPYWRGSLAAVYDRPHFYAPWDGLVEVHGLPGNYQRLASETGDPVFLCTRAEYTLPSPQLMVVQYELQSAGVIGTPEPTLESLGSIPLPNVPTSHRGWRH